MAEAGSEATSGLRERLIAALEERPVCPHKSVARTDWACAMCDADCVLDVVVAAVEQAEKDTAEKIAQAIETERAELIAFSKSQLAEYAREVYDRAIAIARSAAAAPEQGEAG